MNTNNYCVIMAGGVGSRFWPYSRSQRPKQFLDFFGTGRSLLQQTVDRFRKIIPIENVLIVTNVMYRDLILEQVPELSSEQILCEPARRNTAPCIAYAVARISTMTDKANIVVAASDHLIMQEDEFQRVIATGLGFVEKHDVLLTLGMKQTRPETGYGYIQKNYDNNPIADAPDGIWPVKTFTEKPNLDLAKVFLQSGEFLWNSGIFLWNLPTIRKNFRQYLPEMADAFMQGEHLMRTPQEEEYIRQVFSLLPSLSVDYGIMEKAEDVYVLEADFGWSDLGTWGSLYDKALKDEHENATLKSDALYFNSHGNVVALEAGKLAVIEGLDDMIVAESDGVLLICKKENEQKIKQMVAEVEQRYEKRFS